VARSIRISVREQWHVSWAWPYSEPCEPYMIHLRPCEVTNKKTQAWVLRGFSRKLLKIKNLNNDRCGMLYGVPYSSIEIWFFFSLSFLYFLFSYHSIFLQNPALQLKIPLLVTHSLHIALLSHTLHLIWHWHSLVTNLEDKQTGH
jgi:hypothetical protein